MEVDRADYVLDANVIMAILISGKSYHHEVLSTTNCYSVDFVYDEINKYKTAIQLKSKLSGSSLQRFVFTVFGLITVVPTFIINDEDWGFAVKLCEGIDSKDVAYVALSKATGFPLVTRDKPLQAGLRRKGFWNVLLFSEFLESL